MLQVVWGWQPALYLFLGGMGAGTFVMAAVLYLIDRTSHARIICVSQWASAISLGAGLLLLLLELTQPMRGLMMWQSFSHFTSWMTYGAWGAFSAIAVFGISAVLATKPLVTWLFRMLRRNSGDETAELGDVMGAHVLVLARTILAVVGIGLGLFVAVYTGMLLMMAPGVPLWNTPLLPCLFAVSGLDTGVAFVEIVAVLLSRKEALTLRARTLMEGLVVVLVVVECVVLGLLLYGMLCGGDGSAASATAARSADLLTSGILSPYFWGMVVACGLALPLLMAIVGLAMRKRHVSALMILGAAGALIGGCELRFLMLAAGLHADLVTETVLSMIS